MTWIHTLVEVSENYKQARGLLFLVAASSQLVMATAIGVRLPSLITCKETADEKLIFDKIVA